MASHSIFCHMFSLKQISPGMRASFESRSDPPKTFVRPSSAVLVTQCLRCFCKPRFGAFAPSFFVRSAAVPFFVAAAAAQCREFCLESLTLPSVTVLSRAREKKRRWIGTAGSGDSQSPLCRIRRRSGGSQLNGLTLHAGETFSVVI